MTTTEQTQYLSRIKARCLDLLALAEKRTPGKWFSDLERRPLRIFQENAMLVATTRTPDHTTLQDQQNADFIASCAGPAEAGWRSTIAAIDLHLIIIAFEERHGTRPNKDTLDSRLAIIAAWHEELLN